MKPTLNIIIDPKEEYLLHNEYINGDWKDLSMYDSNTAKIRIIEELKDLNTPEVINSVRSLQEEWDKINDDFFGLFEKVTGYRPSREKYECVVCFKMNTPGFSDPLKIGNQFIISSEEITSDKDILYVLAHELFHTIYYEVYALLGLSTVSPTIITESTAILALLFTEMRMLFPKSINHTTQFINSYSETKENWDELLKLWNTRKSFNDYVFRAFQRFC